MVQSLSDSGFPLLGGLGGGGGQESPPTSQKFTYPPLPNFYSLPTKSQFSPLINCSRVSLIPVKPYLTWCLEHFHDMTCSSWHDKTTAFGIYDQNKYLYNLPDQLFLLQSWELQAIVNLHLAHQISNTHQILIVWNYEKYEIIAEAVIMKQWNIW